MNSYSVEIGDNIIASVTTTNTTVNSNVSILINDAQFVLSSSDGLSWSGTIDTRDIGVVTAVTVTVIATNSYGGDQEDMDNTLMVSQTSLEDPRETIVTIVERYYGTDADGDTISTGSVEVNNMDADDEGTVWYDPNKSDIKQITVNSLQDIEIDYRNLGMSSNQKYKNTEPFLVRVWADTKEKAWSMREAVVNNILHNETVMKTPGGGLNRLLCFNGTRMDQDCRKEGGCLTWSWGWIVLAVFTET